MRELICPSGKSLDILTTYNLQGMQIDLWRIAMTEIKTRPLFKLELELDVLELKGTPLGTRRIAAICGGTFTGDRLNGKVTTRGGGWMLIRQDKMIDIEMRITLQTDDDCHIYMQWKGMRPAPGEEPEEEYYFRATPYFETNADKYDWLNRICSIAAGSVSDTKRSLEVFEVL
jgi:hypothetical protein